jgi:16S rRNA processing protein RimM
MDSGLKFPNLYFMPEIDKSFIAVGKILRAYGNSGRVKILVYSGLSDRFRNIDVIYLKGPSGMEGRILKEVKEENEVIIKLKGIDSREDAKELVGTELFLPEAESIDLPENSYFRHSLIGLEVVDLQKQKIGVVEDIIEMGGNDILVVRGEKREILIPAVAEFVKSVDLETRSISVRLWDGM